MRADRPIEAEFVRSLVSLGPSELSINNREASILWVSVRRGWTVLSYYLISAKQSRQYVPPTSISFPESAILLVCAKDLERRVVSADQSDRGLWERDCPQLEKKVENYPSAPLFNIFASQPEFKIIALH